MSRAILDHVTASSIKKVPDIKPGSTVKVYQKITEGEKQRIQMFQGLVISVSAGHNVDKTFTVRKVVEGVGVEKIFPFHSPTIEKIEVVKQGKVRRAKLYYMRDLQGKSTRLRETELFQSISGDVKEEKEEKMEEPKTVEPELTAEEPAMEPVVTEETPPEEASVEEEQK